MDKKTVYIKKGCKDVSVIVFANCVFLVLYVTKISLSMLWMLFIKETGPVLHHHHSLAYSNGVIQDSPFIFFTTMSCNEMRFVIVNV